MEFAKVIKKTAKHHNKCYCLQLHISSVVAMSSYLWRDF